MSFATPIALALAGLAVPILILYILKVRMRRLPVSTNLFWRQIYDEKPPRSIWQNLRHLLSLLAQLAFLCLLVLAIADPYMPWQLLQARRIVLVLDNSASMQATDVQPHRFAAAQAFALDFIDGLRERDQLAIVVAGETPEVVVGMTGHLPTLKRAIESIQPSDNSTKLASAIRLGEKLVGQHPHGQVLVLTDGCVEASDLETESATSPESIRETSSDADVANISALKVTFKVFGENSNNVGITKFQVRRSLTDPLGYEILASVLNASAMPVRCRLEIMLDDAPVDVVPLKLAPGELWKRAFEKTSIEGGTLVGRLTKFDLGESVDGGTGESEKTSADSIAKLNRLSVDDSAWAVLPAREIQKVLMVTPGNLFLRKVFEASPLVDLTVTDAFPDVWPIDSVIVLHQDVPEKLPPGNVFILDPVGDSDSWEITGEIADPIITQQDEVSPLMTHIRLDNVVVPRAAKLEFSGPTQVLAGTVSGEPVYAQVRRSSGKCLVLLVNLEQSDLAFRTSFPIMVTNALNWFAGQSGQLQPSLETGSILRIDLSDQIGEVDDSLLLTGPDNESSTVALSDNGQSCTIGPLEQVGVWSLAASSKQTASSKQLGADVTTNSVLLRSVAVNVADQRETNLVPLEEISAIGEATVWGGGWLTRPLWFYLTLVAGLFAGAEWFLYHRRFIR